MSVSSQDLQPLLDDAERSIDPRGELPASSRLVLHRGMDELLSSIHANAGHYTRAKLAVACAASCARHIDRHPDAAAAAAKALEHAELVLQGAYDAEMLEAENEALHAVAESLMGLDAPFVPAIYATFATHAAVNTVLYDSDFDTLGIDEHIAAPADWDASFYASLAHSGGAVWETTGDDRVRRAFWEWYLREAIPFAWDTDRDVADPPPFST
ncbi:Imm5 family immunity protein [Agromyces sp. LHK192]|uniref:Imm5 family immunity protein n=1 Tax=Agromyces sp. LHK192 TaxID=2498704 RepID=UPI0013E3656A|nr:Imm5 family immunity protein [Agromyces sp. LHK192]